MMDMVSEETRGAAVRAMLVDYAATGDAPRMPVKLGVALVLTGVIAGFGSAGALAATGGFAGFMYPANPDGTSTSPEESAVSAPPGTIPGAPIISLLGDPVVVAVKEALSVPLEAVPVGATHARVTLVAETPGSVAFGTSPGDANPSATWSAEDLSAGTAGSSYDFPLDDNVDALYFTPAVRFEAIASIQYVTHVPTRLGVNASGETFGIDSGPGGFPDLVAVSGIGPDGQVVDGYARRSDLYADDPDHAREPTSPAEALEWQEAREEKYPDGWLIPIFKSDGVTEVGTLRIGDN